MYIYDITGGKRFHKAASEANYNNNIGKAGNDIPDNDQDRGNVNGFVTAGFPIISQISYL